jgi:FkbM family methyltransferase
VVVLETLPCEFGLIRRGFGWRDRIALLRIASRLHLQEGLRARVGRPVPMGRVRYVDVRVRGLAWLRLRTNDVPIFEVLGCHAYGVDLDPLGEVQTVLDLGANVGFASIYFAHRLPGAAVYAVEPSPSSFALLEENLARNVPRARALRAAVAVKPKALFIVEGHYGGLTHVVPQRVSTGAPVDGLPLTALLDRAGFDFADLVKIDIQGDEAALFRDAQSWADRVGAIIAEVHPPCTVDEAAGLLAPHGFERLPLPGGRLFDDMLYARR